MNNEIDKELWPSEEKLHTALKDALYRVNHNMRKFDRCFPSEEITDKRFYGIIENWSWTAGFWPGVLWLAWELTGDEKYKNYVDRLLESFHVRIEKKIFLEHHDLGFIYSLSLVAAYILTGDEQAKKSSIMAAEHLAKRFEEKGQFINAWNDPTKHNPRGHFYIVDCMLNVPLLYWASRVTGNDYYREIADKHVNTTRNTVIRPDGSTSHLFFFDVDTGMPLHGETSQGFSDDSAWSRGQAWAVYGFALNYSETSNPKSLEAFKSVANYFADHLPSDYIPYWDFVFTDGEEPRDSSAALIFICAVLEMLKICPEDSDVKRYQKIAGKMLNSIIDNYATKPSEDTDGFVRRVTGSIPHNEAVDAIGIYADYFYMEIFARLLRNDWKKYW